MLRVSRVISPGALRSIDLSLIHGYLFLGNSMLTDEIAFIDRKPFQFNDRMDRTGIERRSIGHCSADRLSREYFTWNPKEPSENVPLTNNVVGTERTIFFQVFYSQQLAPIQGSN